MKKDINPDLYHYVYAISSYEELMLKLAIFNITSYDDLTEQEFNEYHRDDWKWHMFACSIASNSALSF